MDKDFGLVLQEWALLPNNDTPNTMAMEFNWLTINGKSAPATTPLIVKQGERVRIRLVNLGMDHHPIHIHGHQFYVTGTEGGRIPETAWYPGNTVLVGSAQARDIEFDALCRPYHCNDYGYGEEAMKHINKEGSREHVVWWDTQGRHCSEPECEVNKPEKCLEKKKT